MNRKNLDISSVAARLMVAMRPDFEILCLGAAKESEAQSESEIEAIVQATFRLCGKVTSLKVAVMSAEPEPGDWIFALVPQYQWNSYRIDFAMWVKGNPAPVFIECDGHDFHERTKEQAERDRSRDRAIQAAGIPVLRFTGREIWRDASAVMVEIINFVSDRRDRDK